MTFDHICEGPRTASWLSDSENEGFHPDENGKSAIFSPEVIIIWVDYNNDSDNEDDGDLNNLSAREFQSRAEYIIDFLGLKYSF